MRYIFHIIFKHESVFLCRLFLSQKSKYTRMKHNTYHRIKFLKKLEKRERMISRTAVLKRDMEGIYLVAFALCA